MIEIIPATPIPIYDQEGNIVFHEGFTSRSHRYFVDALGSFVSDVMANRMEHGTLKPFGNLPREEGEQQ